MKTRILLTPAACALALGCVVLVPRSAQAGGIDLYEIATPDVGLASAGYSARAQDASTLFKNPAGMSLLQGSQAQGGLQMLYGNVQFTPDAGSSARLGRNDGGNALGALPGGSFFYVDDLMERVKVGVGAFSYFGLAEKYNDNWVGRYYVQQAAVLGMSFMPAASLKVTDWLSVGGGPNVMFGYLKDKTAINNQTPGFPDGQLSLQDRTWGVGGIGGILIQPREGTRFGATYVSPVNLDFSPTPTIGGVVPSLGTALANRSQLNLGVTVPQTVMFGIYQDLCPKWAVMADVGWQDWHQFGEATVSVQGPGGAQTQTITTERLEYQNTWHGAIGLQYRYSEKWQFTGGFAYDTSAVSDSNRGIVLPMGQAYRYGLGAEYQLNEKLNIGAAYEFVWMGDMPVTQGSDANSRGRVSGSFNNAWISFFTLNLTYKF